MISSYGYYHLYTPKGIYVNPSPNVTDGSTTQQLSAPSGKSFVPGTIEDTTDSPSNIDLESGQFTELEYSLFGVALQDGETYEFRISDGGNSLTTYTVTPQWIIGTSGSGTEYILYFDSSSKIINNISIQNNTKSNINNILNNIFTSNSNISTISSYILDSEISIGSLLNVFNSCSNRINTSLSNLYNSKSLSLSEINNLYSSYSKINLLLNYLTSSKIKITTSLSELSSTSFIVSMIGSTIIDFDTCVKVSNINYKNIDCKYAVSSIYNIVNSSKSIINSDILHRLNTKSDINNIKTSLLFSKSTIANTNYLLYNSKSSIISTLQTLYDSLTNISVNIASIIINYDTYINIANSISNNISSKSPISNFYSYENSTKTIASTKFDIYNDSLFKISNIVSKLILSKSKIITSLNILNSSKVKSGTLNTGLLGTKNKISNVINNIHDSRFLTTNLNSIILYSTKTTIKQLTCQILDTLNISKTLFSLNQATDIKITNILIKNIDTISQIKYLSDLLLPPPFIGEILYKEKAEIIKVLEIVNKARLKKNSANKNIQNITEIKYKGKYKWLKHYYLIFQPLLKMKLLLIL